MILDEIAAKTKERVTGCKEQIPFEEMKAKALAIVEKETENGTKPYTVFPFRDNLAKPGISFICEVKKASYLQLLSDLCLQSPFFRHIH